MRYILTSYKQGKAVECTTFQMCLYYISQCPLLLAGLLEAVVHQYLENHAELIKYFISLYSF